jgi:CelD/BcsL family acetyltransferase involved in cellulose biosynthesis
MTVIQIDPCQDLRWQQFVNQTASNVFHAPAWLQVLTATYGFDISAYLLLDDMGEPSAGIPVCHVCDLRGERNLTLPFSDYCDPLVSNQAQWCALTEQILAKQISYMIRCLHNNLPVADKRFTLVNKAKWHGLNLQPNLSTLWNNLESSARRAIKKAQQQGVIVRLATREEELRTFFAMHLGVRKRKYRLLAQPYRFFTNIWHHFIEQEHGALMVAEYEGNMIGATLFLEWQNTLYYKFNASTSQELAVRPNDLIIWEGIMYAKDRGYTSLDFGLSDWDQEGLVRYKRKFATEEKTISFLRYQPDEEPSQQEKGLRRLLPQLTNLFTDESIPDHVTEAAGEILYQYFT